MVALISCEEDKDSPKEIELTGGASTSHTIYADETQKSDGIKFNAAAPWTATVSEVLESKAGGSEVGWLTLSLYEGKAGEHTLSLTLMENYTGTDRKAEIKIVSGGSTIIITVEQKATTKEGEIPKPKPSGSGILMNETIKKSCNLVGAAHEIIRDNVVRIVFAGEGEEIDGKAEKFDFWADFVNPLQNGRLQSGTYNIRNINYFPYEEFKAGECGWWKSALGSYGNSGTIKVGLAGSVYTFTINILLETGFTDQYETLKGSFTGVPRYLNEEIKVESITLNETQKTLELGGEFALVAAIAPENATNKKVTWNSSNKEVATVSEDGLVKGVSAGTATITATTVDGNKTTTCEITVTPAVAVESIKVDPAEISLLRGEEYEGELKITVLPENAHNKSYTWKSSNSSVADFTGKAIEAKAPGEAIITFTTENGAKTATLKITVIDREASGEGTLTFTDPSGKYEDEVVSILEIEHTILAKNEVNLVFVNSEGKREGRFNLYNPLSDGRLAAGNYTCTYPESKANGTFSGKYLEQFGYWNKGNVSVTIDGNKYTITMTNVGTTNGYTVTGSYTGKLICTNEYVDVNSVVLNRSDLTLTFGDDYLDLTATVLPDNAFNKNVSWSSSDPDIIYVNQAGDLKPGSKTGTATVTVTTEDGAKTASCVVTVQPIPATGDGTFSNNNGELVNVKRAVQWVNEKDPKNVDLIFFTENSTSEAMRFTLTRGNGDTGGLKAGTYKTISYLMAVQLGVKYSYSVTGTATVTVSGEQYTVALDATTEDGVKITGSYTGTLRHIK